MANSYTPNPMDSFSRMMAAKFDERPIQSVPAGFLAFFGVPGMSQTLYSDDAETVDIDIVRANGMKLAAMVHRGMSSDPSDVANITDQKFSAFSRKWPLIEVLNPINSDKLLKRIAGEPATGGFTRVERNRDYAYNLRNDALIRSIRTQNYLAAKSMLTGKQPAIIGTTNNALTYDFLRDSDLTISPDVAWDAEGATPMADIDLACERVESLGNAIPNFLGIDAETWGTLIQDSTFQALADNRRFELIEVTTNNPVPPEYERYVKAGWIPRGRLRTIEGRTLWVFNYNMMYTDPSTGALTKYMPKGYAFVTDINARRDRYFGPEDHLPVTSDISAWYAEMFGVNMSAPPVYNSVSDKLSDGIVTMDMFHFDAYRSPDNKSVYLRTQSAPIYATTQTDAICTLKDLLT